MEFESESAPSLFGYGSGISLGLTTTGFSFLGLMNGFLLCLRI